MVIKYMVFMSHIERSKQSPKFNSCHYINICVKTDNSSKIAKEIMKFSDFRTRPFKKDVPYSYCVVTKSACQTLIPK